MENKCKNCKYFITEGVTPSRKSEIPEGWGFCSCSSIKTLDNHWNTANESNPRKDSIFTSYIGIGYLSESLMHTGVFGQFIVGENFGCVHFNKKQ